MASKWKSTQYTGVRYREHPKRRYQGKPDRYFAIRYKINGKLKEEALGWASEGWNAQRASIERSNLRKAQTLGQGPQTLREKRQIAKEKRDAELAKKRRKAKESLTFGQYFKETYFPNAKTDKEEQSWKREISLFNIWISPVIGEMPLKDIRPLHLERIKKNMMDADKAHRTINYAIAVIRQVFNSARQNGLFQGISPVNGVRKLKVDNKRLRFLTQAEADRLLDELHSKSQKLFEMSMISLHCGLRADEILSLMWGDINIEAGTILVRDTKNKKSRIAFMTNQIKELLSSRKRGNKEELLFPRHDSQKYKEIPRLFREIISEIGFNDGITDRRQKVVFHTLRHTFASWMVQNGESLYTVKELMGHSTLAMTERYSHLAKDNLKQAVRRFDKNLKIKKKESVLNLEKEKVH